MGKGKKKGKPSALVPSLEQLTLSEATETPQPSTSVAEEPEDEGGLGLTGRSKKRSNKKKIAEASSLTATTPSAVTVPLSESGTGDASAIPAVAESEAPVIASGGTESKPDTDVGGLGLGEKRKRPPRRKKLSAAAQAARAGSDSLETDTVPVPTAVASTSAVSPPSRSFVGSGPQAGPSQGEPVLQKHTFQPGPSDSKVQVADPNAQPTRPDTALCRFAIPKIIRGNTVKAQTVTLLCNYLEMKMKPVKIYRYDVGFKPEKPKKLITKAYAVAKQKLFKNNVIAFDQTKNCYSTAALKNVTGSERFSTQVEVEDNNGKLITYEVSFKFTGLVDLNTIYDYMNNGKTSLSPPSEAIQCVDVILRQGTLEAYIKAGRQYFQRPARPIDLGDGLEMWTGLFQSAIFTSRPYVNIDVAHKGFPKCQPLIEAYVKDFRLDPRKSLEMQRGYSIENFRSFMKGLKVVAMIGGDSSKSGQRREFICNKIMRSSREEMFSFEDPVTSRCHKLSVADYFANVKKVRLQYPDLNCVWVGPREKTIYYPIELLEVGYGQPQNKQLNEIQLATMVRQAATPPDERKRKIEEVIRNMNYSRNEHFKKFGLEISDKFHEVKARVLMPPRLDVGGKQQITPMRGVWQANQVFKPESLTSWGFVAVEIDVNRCNCEKIIDMFQVVGRQMGMNIGPPQLKYLNVKLFPGGRNDERMLLKDVFVTAVKKDVTFLFVVVSGRGHDFYHRVKQMAECEVGILTQCIREKTASIRFNMQTVKNLLLKVNSKLMGVNQALSQITMPQCLKGGNVMIVGADVTHPSPDQSDVPSIAAVTASIDGKCFLYNIELSIQTPKKEMIVEFEDMMVDHLKVYRNNLKDLPKKIFVFRDGVSEGQFAQVMNSELQAVHNAYRKVSGPTGKPEVLFLLVQKRHHTRLFIPNSPQNVEPGTVVDTDIVHASELDFYLVSHHAIKGTARPTRYHTVCNDGCIPHDEVEQLTYYLCHLYARCMRSVSYPTPTYYAHLACFRARSLTYGEKFNNKELEKNPRRLRVMDKILKHSRMFFI